MTGWHLYGCDAAGRIEDVNAVEAYVGTLPGRGHPNVRPLMHKLNVADILPLTAV